MVFSIKHIHSSKGEKAMLHKIWVSNRKFKELQNQLNKLKNEDFPKNRRGMKEAIEGGGGMHDNAAYEHALQDERLLLSKIAKLESSVSMTQIIPPVKQTDSVQVGHRIKAIDLKTDELYEITICGYMDTDISRNWYSYQAPLAASFIGKRVGDQIRFVSPAGEEKLWKITEITIANLENKGGDNGES